MGCGASAQAATDVVADMYSALLWRPAKSTTIVEAAVKRRSSVFDTSVPATGVQLPPPGADASATETGVFAPPATEAPPPVDADGGEPKAKDPPPAEKGANKSDGDAAGTKDAAEPTTTIDDIYKAHPECEAIGLLFGGAWDAKTVQFASKYLLPTYAYLNEYDDGKRRFEVVFVDRPCPDTVGDADDVPDGVKGEAFGKRVLDKKRERWPWPVLAGGASAPLYAALEKRFGKKGEGATTQLVIVARDGRLLNFLAHKAVQGNPPKAARRRGSISATASGAGTPRATTPRSLSGTARSLSGTARSQSPGASTTPPPATLPASASDPASPPTPRNKVLFDAGSVAAQFPWRDNARRIFVFKDCLHVSFPGHADASLQDPELLKAVQATVAQQGDVTAAHGEAIWQQCGPLRDGFRREQRAPKCGKCKAVLAQQPGEAGKCTKCRKSVGEAGEEGALWACPTNSVPGPNCCGFALCAQCAEPKKIHDFKLSPAERAMHASVRDQLATLAPDAGGVWNVSHAVAEEELADFDPASLLDLALKELDAQENTTVNRVVAEVVVRWAKEEGAEREKGKKSVQAAQNRAPHEGQAYRNELGLCQVEDMRARPFVAHAAKHAASAALA